MQNYSCIQKQRLVTDWLVEAEAVEYRWMLMVSMIKKKADKDKSRSVTAPIVGYDQPSSTPLLQFKSQNCCTVISCFITFRLDLEIPRKKKSVDAGMIGENRATEEFCVCQSTGVDG